LHAAAGDPPRRARLRLRRLLPRFPQDQQRLARRHATGRRLLRWAALLPRRRPSCFLNYAGILAHANREEKVE
ncbi:unnamed protein product, partial [Musa acuminata subsp. burmannicoides]